MNTRGDACTAQAEKSFSAMRLRAKCRNFVYARLHGISTATRAYEHPRGCVWCGGVFGR